MTKKYTWVYSMWKLKAWLGPPLPDDPLHPDDILNGYTFVEDGGEPNPRPMPVVTTGFIGFGIHVQKALYEDDNFCDVLRVSSFFEIEKKYPQCTKIQLNTFRDAEIIGAFRQAHVTLKAVSETLVYPFFGKEHTTTIVIGNCAKLSEIIDFLRVMPIEIGPNKIQYTIEPNSFQIKTPKSKSEIVY